MPCDYCFTLGAYYKKWGPMLDAGVLPLVEVQNLIWEADVLELVIARGVCVMVIVPSYWLEISERTIDTQGKETYSDIITIMLRQNTIRSRDLEVLIDGVWHEATEDYGDLQDFTYPNFPYEWKYVDEYYYWKVYGL